MLKKTLTYEDFNGVERTEDFYFNFTEAECVEWNLTTEGGLVETTQKIVAAKEQKELVELFKEFVLKAYGEKSPDGRRFMKTPEIREAFSQTNAFSIIFLELAKDDIAANEFIQAVIPKKVDTNKAIPAPAN